MLLQFSLDKQQYFVWRRDSYTVKTFRGTVAAFDASDALTQAWKRWGGHCEVKLFKHSRSLEKC